MSPKQKVKQFELKMILNSNVPKVYESHYDEIILKNPNQKLTNETIAYYQTCSEILKNKQYQKEWFLKGLL